MDFKIYRSSVTPEQYISTAASQLEASMEAQKLSLMEPDTIFLVAVGTEITSTFINGEFQF